MGCTISKFQYLVDLVTEYDMMPDSLEKRELRDELIYWHRVYRNYVGDTEFECYLLYRLAAIAADED